MTNGEDVIISGVMKPIPTMLKPLDSVDINTKQKAQAHYERSDVCAVESCAVVAQARTACILANEILLKYGADNMEELTQRFS